ncbi:hypothetical protein PR048_000403 [Dryococelus australis]|uniref:Uncharacterized protein n=1 Tax=Dryococelus australis TaxID=614101 RepID=A0ABQ9IEI2_9NEOP|nr:hypothetical protein PR048_000403 [Dryococelus australis]
MLESQYPDQPDTTRSEYQPMKSKVTAASFRQNRSPDSPTKLQFLAPPPHTQITHLDLPRPDRTGIRQEGVVDVFKVKAVDLELGLWPGRGRRGPSAYRNCRQERGDNSGSGHTGPATSRRSRDLQQTGPILRLASRYCGCSIGLRRLNVLCESRHFHLPAFGKHRGRCRWPEGFLWVLLLPPTVLQLRSISVAGARYFAVNRRTFPLFLARVALDAQNAFAQNTLPTDRDREISRFERLNRAAQECKVAGETGDPRENPLTSGIVRHDSHFRKIRDRTRFALVRGKRSNRSATAAPMHKRNARSTHC